ncbi:MAG: leucyl aminopeptidase [Actinomyces sp.]|nr:MAG: leucyl aminopeptidase [Actinomyces sp.]
MSPTLHAARTTPRAAELVATLVTADAVSEGLAGIDAAALERAGFEGKRDQTHTWSSEGRLCLLVGVGDDAASVGPDALRRGAALAARASSVRRLAIETGPGIEVDADGRRALAEGAVLGDYRFTVYKTSSTRTRLARVDVVGASGKRAQADLERGVVVAEAQCLARDLVNEPGGVLTPPEFARRAARAARAAGVKVDVWTKADIEKAKLGGLLGVNRGSSQPPRLVELTYQPSGRARGRLALVGKGLTFDAGGLSIKTGQGMMTMKMDMGGAAAVVAAMTAIARLAPPVRVHAIVPLTDNMLGGDATRPGDVLRIRNGKTIEVLNTDAEGRLVLADGLSLASERRPDAIVDLATLTGACMVALGPRIAGLMGNDEAFVDQVKAAAEAAGERVWPLPLPDDYRKMIDSKVADMKNIGGPHGGALTAGLLLREFVRDGIAWAHLDIAGPAWSDDDEGEISAGGTGFGVRTLVALAERFGA